MFNKIFICLIIPTLLFSATTFKMEYRFNEAPQVINGGVYLKGCRMARDGFAPKVAVKPVTLMVPRGYTVKSYEVIYDGLTQLNGKYTVDPFRPAIRIGSKPFPGYYTQRSPVYSINEPYPQAKRSGWFNVQYKWGVPIFYTCVNPVQYNPVEGTLQYFNKISVVLNLEQTRDAPVYQCSPAQRSMIEVLVDNKAEVNNLPLTTKDADDYECLIVSMDALKDSWGDFVNFNKRRGMRTKIHDLSYVISNSTGVDRADQLRNFITKEYTDNKISFVILGGDALASNNSYIPSRNFRAQMYDNFVAPERYHDEKNLCADMYFECLDGDWKGSNDYYGEPGAQDMTWEVFAGRFPVTSASQLANMINKTIKYSEEPVVASINRLVLAGNFLWDDYGVECYGDDIVEEFIGHCTNNNYETYGFPRNEWEIDSLYERHMNWSASTFRSTMNSHRPTLVCHSGHGNTTYCFQETNSGVTTNNYTANGTNGNYFFLLSDACYPAKFDGSSECIFERFVRLETGAFAGISNDDSGWGDDDGSDGAGDRPLRLMWNCMFNPDIKMHHLQCLHTGGKEANSEIVLNLTINDPPYFGAVTFSIYETNLLGDPAVSLWTKSPQEFQADYADPLTTNTFVWNTKNPYTWVALANEAGEIITAQWSDKDGNINITDDVFKQYVQQNPSGKFKVIVKAHNYYPFEGECTIQSSSINSNFNGISFSGITFLGNTALIKYNMKNAGTVNISVYNSKGLLLKTIINDFQSAGTHSAAFNKRELSNGIYYCSMSMNNNKMVEKFIVTK
ncbi:C25 family cysteine peptidase [Fibrobacterota bacterium]